MGMRGEQRSGGVTWKDLMNVQSNVRIPSPLLRSLTSRMTRKRRKKVIEMRELSSELWGWACGGYAQSTFAPATSLSHALAPPASKSLRTQAPGWSGSISKDFWEERKGGLVKREAESPCCEVVGWATSPRWPPFCTEILPKQR